MLASHRKLVAGPRPTSSRAGLAPRYSSACTATGRAAVSGRCLAVRTSAAATVETPKPKVVNPHEESRKFRRNVFSPADWVKHRSTGRYLRHITTMLTSGNVASLLGPTLAVSALSLVLELLEVGQAQHIIPDWPSSFQPLSALPFTIAGASLSLLLVFRTNASYGRWDEARKMWGLMVNRSRDITRQAVRWFPEEEDGLKDMFVRYMQVLPKSMMVHLRSDEDLKTVCSPYLLPEEYAALEASPQRPMHVLQVLGAIIQSAKLQPMEKTSMDLNLTAFEDVLGGCERIYRTPIPVSYTRLTSRFLIMYLFALPWCLVPQLHIAAIPACSLTTFFMLGIEEIGVQIEEPFSILALEVIAETIAGNVKASREEARTKIPGLVAQSMTVKAIAAPAAEPAPRAVAAPAPVSELARKAAAAPAAAPASKPSSPPTSPPIRPVTAAEKHPVGLQPTRVMSDFL